MSDRDRAELEALLENAETARRHASAGGSA